MALTFHTITVSLSEEEYLALRSDITCCDTWVNNYVHERARISIDIIVSKYVNYALENNINIPSNKLEIIKEAYKVGIVVFPESRNNSESLPI